jgi:hypothetical protein
MSANRRAGPDSIYRLTFAAGEFDRAHSLRRRRGIYIIDACNSQAICKGGDDEISGWW